MELDVLNFIIETYEDTIDRLVTTGVGNETEFGNIVTDKMMNTIIDRMNTLKIRRMHLLDY